MTAIVELKNVTKAVSNGMNEEKVILDDVSLEIREHDFITILGGNGAGKSTLFNTIAGTLPVSSGKIYILGEDVTNYSPEKRAKADKAFSPPLIRFKDWIFLPGGCTEISTPAVRRSGSVRIKSAEPPPNI